MNRLDQLTTREAEVLRLMTEGLSPREIAAAQVVSISTVRSHVHSIHWKLGVQHNLAAVAYAHRYGLVTA